MSERQLIHRQTTALNELLVYEESGIRYLSFGDHAIQSAIDLAQPGRLQLAVHRALFAPLLFTPKPKSVLILGAGCGCLLQFLKQNDATLECDAVEIQQEVIDVAIDFFALPASQAGYHWQIFNEDAKTFINHTTKKYDLIIIDIAVGELTPGWIFDSNYLSRCAALMSGNGAIAINMLTENTTMFAAYARIARQSFKQRTAFMTVPGHKNIIFMALQQKPSKDKMHEIEVCNSDSSYIQHLSLDWGLEFKEFWARMRNENPAGSGIF